MQQNQNLKRLKKYHFKNYKKISIIRFKLRKEQRICKYDNHKISRKDLKKVK